MRIKENFEIFISFSSSSFVNIIGLQHLWVVHSNPMYVKFSLSLYGFVVLCLSLSLVFKSDVVNVVNVCNLCCSQRCMVKLIQLC